MGFSVGRSIVGEQKLMNVNPVQYIVSWSRYDVSERMALDSSVLHHIANHLLLRLLVPFYGLEESVTLVYQMSVSI